jgi:ABC-type sugar transport system ATPase subunit
MNFLRGRMTESGVDIGPVQVVLDPETRRRITGGSPDVLVGLRPEGLVPTTKVDEAIVGEVEVVEELGAERYLYLRPRGLDVVEQSERPAELAGSICARLTESIGIAAGGTVALRPRPELVRLFDLNTGASRLTVPESC